MRFLLIATTRRSVQSPDVRRLLESIRRQTVSKHTVLVVQGGEDGGPPVVPLEYPDLTVLSHRSLIGLSLARNIALAAAARNGLLDDEAVVGFPDDDCWYPDGFFEKVADELTSRAVDVLACSYGPTEHRIAVERFTDREGALSYSLAVRSSSSITQFFAANVVRNIGAFDERFGVGSVYGSGEDVDYALRALRLGYRGWYVPALIVIHPINPSNRTRYFAGGVALLSKHATAPGVRRLLARRVLGGARLVLLRRLPVRDFCKSLQFLRSARGSEISALRLPLPSG